ncbi:MAG: tRNA (guanosine(37)-N1)-methyltransferase TrmD [Chloroflexota bacterium]
MGPPDRLALREMLTVRIVTLFPALFDCWLDQGVVSRAIERGVALIELIDLRQKGVGRHLVADDYPFGGGPGMVMKPEPLFAALDEQPRHRAGPRILMSPRGRRFDQRVAEDLAQLPAFMLVAGHYEGVDQRVVDHAIDDEISIGDYVLSAGELAAMVVADAVVRLVPGALADEATREESFNGGLLEYPQYTRPAEFRGWQVPPVLVSGDHGEVDKWRRVQALRLTHERRPDLLDDADLTQEERRLLEEWRRTEQRHGG